MPAVLCKFWQRGHCKNGDRCNFEHPGRGNQFHSQNRFGVFQSPGSNASNSPGTGAFGGSPSTQDYPQGTLNQQVESESNVVPRYHLTKDGITDDLTKDLPIWILSAYGPGRDAPRQLFGGHPREQSFEEARLRYYELTASGNQQQAIQEAQALVNNAEQQIQAALNDVDGGIKYIINGENEHPNRLDICKAKGENLGQPLGPSGSQQHLSPVAQSSSFGLPSSSLAPQANKSTGFSLPSTLGWPTPAFAAQRFRTTVIDVWAAIIIWPANNARPTNGYFRPTHSALFCVRPTLRIQNNAAQTFSFRHLGCKYGTFPQPL
ncbi:Zinc finger, CCCH-type [Lasallia pustulata]|uniref:Zinc finger, CCCH-type n=1 Tax=Lasallia pustulata TaxID=136370 RepID=A0A1W5DDM0_9LECA|nr:Zinc finger, CCCH-type [Lasallia pustulata]